MQIIQLPSQARQFSKVEELWERLEELRRVRRELEEAEALILCEIHAELSRAGCCQNTKRPANRR